jgi:acyl-CoA reductase-like NAD-dependent aldehyde dehydrogenase
MGPMQKTITPIDGSLYVERPYNSANEIAASLKAAISAAKAWRKVPVAERARLLSMAVDAFVARKAEIAEEITRQIGRPLGQSPGEVRGPIWTWARRMGSHGSSDAIPWASSSWWRRGTSPI